MHVATLLVKTVVKFMDEWTAYKVRTSVTTGHWRQLPWSGQLLHDRWLELRSLIHFVD